MLKVKETETNEPDTNEEEQCKINRCQGLNIKILN